MKAFLKIVARKRLRFYYYKDGLRPVLCSGYLTSIIQPFAYFRHLKVGKKYDPLDRLMFKNIRFLSSCFNLNDLDKVEKMKIKLKKDIKKLSKFEVIS